MPPEAPALHVNAQRYALTIAEDLTRISSFDREGRLLGCFRDGANYRRGLSGDILRKRAAPDRPKQRRMLAPAERRALLAEVLAHAAAMRERWAASLAPEVDAWLGRVLAWDVERLEAERETFRAIYRPISILPPDQYLSLVVQATEGCSWNRCSFCTLYRDRPFRVKSPDALRQHIRQLKAFLGEGLGLRKAVFLGDANALIIPQPRLRELLQVVHAELPIGESAGLRGIYAFLDIFGAEQKDVADYHELREAQVRRVYIGLESGDPTVFRLLNKPGSPEACLDAVRAIKAAGISVGVILLAGAGGARLADAHVEGSLAALAAMGLGAGDLVYLSPLLVPPDSPYLRQLASAGSPHLDAATIDAQLAAMKAGARARLSPGVKVALYHLEEFMY